MTTAATIDYATRERLTALLLLSRDRNAAENERVNALAQLNGLMARLGLTLEDVERIAAEQATSKRGQEPAEGSISARDMVVVIIALLRQYVWHPDERLYLVAALWILHTHCYRQFRHTPRLLIYAPLSQSGKSTLQTLVRFLSCGGQKLDDPTSAVLVRLIDIGIKTGLSSVFVDEMDNAPFDRTFYHIFNNGFIEGGHVFRFLGKHAVRFEIHAPLCFASISLGGFSHTNLSRSFLFKCHKKGNRKIDKEIESEVYPSDDILDVRWLIEEWAKSIGGNDSLQRTLNRSPAIPDGLIDRDIDRWRPLLSIADACGVGAEAREAAKSPIFAIAQTDMRLLIVTDIRRVFDGLNAHHDRIWSDPLVKGLHALHDSPWSSEFTGLDDKKNPHKITAGELGHILRKEWEIRSGPVRIGGKVLKGYYRRDFEQAWSDVGLPPSPKVKQQRNASAGARPESVTGPKADSLLGLQRYK
jgi:Protein of unknown function (DUF3631)